MNNNIDLERKKYIEDKTHKYGEVVSIIADKKKWKVYSSIITLIAMLLIAIMIACGNMLITFIFIFMSLILYIVEFFTIMSTNNKFYQAINFAIKEDIDENFVPNKYSSEEDPDVISSDLTLVRGYDQQYSLNMLFNFYFATEVEKVEYDRYIFNGKVIYLNMDWLWTEGKIEYRYSQRPSSTSKYDDKADYEAINILTKINTNKRLFIKTVRKNKNKECENGFDSIFYNDYENTLEYDRKNLEKFKEHLTGSFKKQHYFDEPYYEYLNLDEKLKNKILDIYNKYNIEFTVSIKCGVLRIETVYSKFQYERGYDIAYSLERTYTELLELFMEYEKEYGIKKGYQIMPEEYKGIKNLILDLDNTIILDTEEDSECYREALTNCGYDDDYFYAIFEAIDEYDKILDENNLYYNKEDMVNFINETLGQDYSVELIDEISKCIGKYWTKNILLSKETIEYLASKYNLYIFTNYFEDAQSERIKNIGYEKYFKGIFAADKYGSKPFKKSFENVLNKIEAKPEECLMIGDNKSRDILGASTVNMKAILVDYNGFRDVKDIKLDNYIAVSDINEIKDIL